MKFLYIIKIATVVLFYFFFSNSDFAQDEYELLFNIKNKFSAYSEKQILNQWTAHAKTLTKNTNCLSSIETQLKEALSKNSFALAMGIPFQAQVNYSNCRLEKFINDTIAPKQQQRQQHLIIYHISGCEDPNNSLSNINASDSFDDIPLLVTYKKMGENGFKWFGYDHYGPINDQNTEEDVLKKLMYNENSLTLLCEQKDHRVYKIKNTPKHSKAVNIIEGLKEKGLDMQECIKSSNPLPIFYGRYETLVEQYKDYEIRYILVNNKGKKKILIRFTNKNKNLIVEATIFKGLGLREKIYSIDPSSTLTISFDEMVVFSCDYKKFDKETSVIQTIKEIVRKKVTIDRNKLKIGNTASSGIRG